MSSLRFRTKIFLSQLLLFFLFVLLVFPFVEKTVTRIAHRSLYEFANNLIRNLNGADGEEYLVHYLQRPEFFTFFRVSLLNAKGQLIYDSHLSRLWGDKFIPFYPTEHPEVIEAIEQGQGYSEGYSQIFLRRFIYIAKSFEVAGEKYILRLAFPYYQLEELYRNFDIGFWILSLVLLLFFAITMWLIFYRLSRPISDIIKAIAPYQRGDVDKFPKIHIKASKNQNDEFVRLVMTLNSLSERVQEHIQSLKEERDEKEAILESLGEGVISVDRSMRIRYINYIGSKMLGIHKNKLLGLIFPKNKGIGVSTGLVQKTKELLMQCQREHAILNDFFLLEEGRKVYLDLVAAPKSSGNGAIVVLQDKSSNYKMVEMGKDFVANASHELRTPITIIKGFAETLHDHPMMSPTMLSDVTEKILRNCIRMENLVKKLLVLTDIENLQETRFKLIDLVTVVENCCHEIGKLHPEAVLSIEKNAQVIKLEGDSDLIELAITNIIENGIKYSKNKPEIMISLESFLENVKIAIRDNGIGIPENDIDHIFERFYTVDKTHSRKLGGAGLGLSIVKTIVEKHSGMINADSVLGKGTCFTIILPVAKLRRFEEESEELWQKVGREI